MKRNIVFFVILMSPGLLLGGNLNGCEMLDESGSYVLKRDIDCAGEVCFYLTAPIVILDLGGYAIRGNNAGAGIFISRQTVAIVRNGTLTGFGTGIASEENGEPAFVDRIHSSDHVFDGFALESGSIVSSSQAFGNGRAGIYAEEDAIVRDSVALGSNYQGIYTLDRGRIVRNKSLLNGGDGIRTSYGVVRENTSTLNEDDGLDINCEGLVVGNVLTSNGSSPIATVGSGCQFMANAAQ